VVAPSLQSLRGVIESQLRADEARERARRIQLGLLSDMGVAYEETHLAWAAREFAGHASRPSRDGAPVIEISASLPELTPADTARVLARHRAGVVTAGALLRALESMPAMLRPTLDTADAVRVQVDGIILESAMVALAHARGMGRDPDAVRSIEAKRDELLVERMLADSVEVRVRVTPEMRRAFFAHHRERHVTEASVRFAALVAGSRREADSLRSRLAAGASAADLVRADSLAGRARGSIQQRRASERGPYHRLLFEELTPGEITVQGPDRDGDHLVIQLLQRLTARRLGFAEAEPTVHESVHALERERLIQELRARNTRGLDIEMRRDLVMRIDLRMR
jgi:hypothetical protein